MTQGVNLKASVQYTPPQDATVASVLAIFRSPTWVSYMMRYIVPQLKASTPAIKTALDLCTPVDPATAQDCECVVCMNTENEPSNNTRLPCGHVFHESCIRAWLRRRSTCPTCRYQFEKEIAGRYAIRCINSALILHDVKATKEDMLARAIGGQTLRVVVHVTLIQATECPPNEKYPCVLNAAVMRSPAQTPAPLLTRRKNRHAMQTRAKRMKY
ncbi:unnamed protein product [Aphanomyces euteiches]|uniref:RING-type domain-containing protein n=1 Tax=Aphanomyces euteiches TaxID=100861 RepID=A0A6G0W9X3_9STRA|nr:hypothetical protein Ae201684_017689 [Aphanomyces euteiches]KAH9095473.1 hypothetical protein Ae201684P_014540 [Aphanomyces euteiches]KAH9139574.1 hypothetical protein AeRB84_016164 [Aphanomyces euteiches]